MKLAAACKLCGSWTWCGRPCASAPKAVTPVTAIPNAIPNKPKGKAGAKPVERTKAWREANPEKHRAYMRDLMRKKRTK